MLNLMLSTFTVWNCAVPPVFLGASKSLALLLNSVRCGHPIARSDGTPNHHESLESVNVFHLTNICRYKFLHFSDIG
jgi:hypothetical protein